MEVSPLVVHVVVFGNAIEEWRFIDLRLRWFSLLDLGYQLLWRVVS